MSRDETRKFGAQQVDVAAASVAAGPCAVDETHVLEDVEVVGEEVGLDADELTDLRWGSVGAAQFVDDGEADRVP